MSNTCYLLARIVTHPQTHPVKKSTGKFGALQVGKVLSSVHTQKDVEKVEGKVNSAIHRIVIFSNFPIASSLTGKLILQF